MRRARLNTTHALRCVVYSFDAALWAGMYGVTAIAVGIVIGAQLRQAEFVLYLGIGMILVLGSFYGTVRLYAAYRLYLRFEHALMTVLLSQIVVGLIAANLCLFLHVTADR